MPAIRSVVRLLPVLSLILFCASCSDFWVSESSIQSESVSPTTLLLRTDASSPDSGTLTASYYTVGNPNTAVKDTSAAWSTSDSTVATVKGGVVTIATTTALKSATITASHGSPSATCTVYTYSGKQTSLTVNIVTSGIIQSSVALGAQIQLQALLEPGGTDVTKYVSWTTSNNSVATVSSSGLVSVSSSAATSTQFTITASPTLGDAETAISPVGTQFTTAI